MPIVTDAHAAAAAATIVVNRVKQHTDFHGPYESGLMKMTAIGLGKRVQAEALHAHGTRGLRELMPRVAEHVLANGNIVLGVAIVENALDQTMLRAGRSRPSDIPTAELALLDLARAHAARLPVDDLDVLLIDRMGKDISGVGLDTNVIGRTMILGEADPATPRIAMIACHELTPASHGNATGMGLADVVTRHLADAIDHEIDAHQRRHVGVPAARQAAARRRRRPPGLGAVPARRRRDRPAPRSGRPASPTPSTAPSCGSPTPCAPSWPAATMSRSSSAASRSTIPPAGCARSPAELRRPASDPSAWRPGCRRRRRRRRRSA